MAKQRKFSCFLCVVRPRICSIKQYGQYCCSTYSAPGGHNEVTSAPYVSNSAKSRYDFPNLTFISNRTINNNNSPDLSSVRCFWLRVQLLCRWCKDPFHQDIQASRERKISMPVHI
ncbi:hypothetical protein T265_03027 [Opisthorchis viverrini]|uniref:Uncharacterized protein n=1 Tax=Opisthorchis viverrini TaxID=6198 RepID=A0A074ZSZ7_OPIVI|nr:hypothetical protein T265_03027 [Opisthorchis viverrini]KER30543.1 hypothetical protein T265_03027 [Opisthorchis viverrini]